jgi:4-diphosphocytidyl-2-C-methyl-D-erythritol kinase
VTTLRETAKAKLNLTLQVMGRRADGYHELASLVAFATLGDIVELQPGSALDLVVEGQFAKALSRGNLVIKAAEAAKAVLPGLQLGRFRLIKNLPVAAGLGGGSADAAAALRLLAQANSGALAHEDLRALAAKLGSDVTVCLESRAALMTGRGERVQPLRAFPCCGVVLANPGVELTAGDVYSELGAPPISASPIGEPDVPDFAGDVERLIDYVGARDNDLAASASRLAPVIGDVLAALRDLEGARLARLSGSGPTCFALFGTIEEAEHAAVSLAASRPAWWIVASALQ